MGGLTPEDLGSRYAHCHRLPSKVPVGMVCKNHLGMMKGLKEVAFMSIPILHMWKLRLTECRTLPVTIGHMCDDILTFASCVKRTVKSYPLRHRYVSLLDNTGPEDSSLQVRLALGGHAPVWSREGTSP